MDILVFMVSIMLFIAAIGITWNKLSEFEQQSKIKICIIGTIAILIITILVFALSSIKIEYVENSSKNAVGRILVMLFAPINGIICLPQLAKIINKVKAEEISKEEATKKLVRFLVIILVIFVIEAFYLNDIQAGIIEYANKIQE